MQRTQRYRTTLEHIAAVKDDMPPHPPLRFETTNHDDLFPIIVRLHSFGRWSDDDAAAIALGSSCSANKCGRITTMRCCRG